MDPSSLAITTGAWAWDRYGKTLADRAAGAVKTQWDKVKWKEAAEAYRAKIKKLYGTMQIMGMARPVTLDDIFTDAYMLDRPTAFGRFDIERLKQSSADPDALPEATRVNGLRLVTEKDNLFILGKPGAGKTTFLKYIALKAAEQLINKIPIFVSLKEWADSGAPLMDFIAERFDVCGFPSAQPFVEWLLKSGSAIVLFDGLDEVNQEGGRRDAQTRAMNNFVEKYDHTQCLITCRIAASDYSFKPFTYVEIADFTEEQIQRFVANWFRNNEGEKDEETCRKFLTEFERDDNKGLRDLARTPLLLTLLCLAFNETLTFPQRRVEIYEEAVDALLKKWDSSRRIKRDEVYRKLSLGHKENMLARIAAETFEKNEYFIPQAELERRIIDYVKNVPPHNTNEETDGEAILKAIEAQHGIFVERARQIYSFSHLTFQEYFTARYFVANADKGTLTNLVKGHCMDLRWREVFLLTTSLLPDAGQFIKAFRRGVDELLEGDGKLTALLAWASGKSASLQNVPWLVRPNYLFRELHYSSEIGYELARALARFQDYDRNRDREYSLDYDLDIAYSCARIRFNVSDIHSARSLTLDLNRAHTHATILSRDLGLNELARELATLSTPTDTASAAEWEEYASNLRVLMINHRDISHEWNLTEMHEARLAAYLDATDLLRSCLELAFMPPEEKRAVLESLYLPPGRWVG